MDNLIAEHVSRLRELAKEADDFSIRLSAFASELEDRYRELSNTIFNIPVKQDESVPRNEIHLVDDEIPF